MNFTLCSYSLAALRHQGPITLAAPTPSSLFISTLHHSSHQQLEPQPHATRARRPPRVGRRRQHLAPAAADEQISQGRGAVVQAAGGEGGPVGLGRLVCSLFFLPRRSLLLLFETALHITSKMTSRHIQHHNMTQSPPRSTASARPRRRPGERRPWKPKSTRCLTRWGDGWGWVV